MREKLPIPEHDKGIKVDVGKIITLYNHGWAIKDIAGDTRKPISTVRYWIKKAAEGKNE